jgi:hypothetical protein
MMKMMNLIVKKMTKKKRDKREIQIMNHWDHHKKKRKRKVKKTMTPSLIEQK